MPADAGDTLRAFVALDLDSMSTRRVARVADRLRMGSGAPSASWTAPAKMHVTVKFLGDVPREKVTPFAKTLEPLVAGAAPGPAPFRLDALPSVAAAHMVIAVLDDPGGEIGRLAALVDKAARALGVPPSKRSFLPHVTLARLKVPYDVRRWLRPELAPGTDNCGFSSLTLFESKLTDQGSTHSPLARFEYPG
jgi:RNA 2',3'-cyclic 3'-phosphodiesterase